MDNCVVGLCVCSVKCSSHTWCTSHDEMKYKLYFTKGEGGCGIAGCPARLLSVLCRWRAAHVRVCLSPDAPGLLVHPGFC